MSTPCFHNSEGVSSGFSLGFRPSKWSRSLPPSFTSLVQFINVICLVSFGDIKELSFHGYFPFCNVSHFLLCLAISRSWKNIQRGPWWLHLNWHDKKKCQMNRMSFSSWDFVIHNEQNLKKTLPYDALLETIFFFLLIFPEYLFKKLLKHKLKNMQLPLNVTGIRTCVNSQ